MQFQIVVSVLSFLKYTTNSLDIKESFFEFSMKGCRPSETLVFQSVVGDIGMCFSACHKDCMCQSMTYSQSSNECVGYRHCPVRGSCGVQVPQTDWVTFCEGKLILRLSNNGL